MGGHVVELLKGQDIGNIKVLKEQAIRKIKSIKGTGFWEDQK